MYPFYDISGKKYNNKKKTAMELLEKVSIGEEESNRRILKLSGGHSSVSLLQELFPVIQLFFWQMKPTGNLDSETQKDIMQIFLELAHKENCCVIIVTHSNEVAESADVVYKL